jgi:nucleoside-diphosphate-sugar epimerase
MRYFITGGTGFIGRRLVEKIISMGGEITLFVREISDLNGLDEIHSIKVVKGSLFDKDFMCKAMKGCDVVFHLAGYAKNWSSDKSIYKKINVDGSINVAEAALSAGVKTMVDVSSIVTFGPTDKTEHSETPVEGIIKRFTEYEKSKAESEERLIEFAKKYKNLKIVVVNPARVYGPGLITEANSLTLIIKNYLNLKFYLLLGTGKNVANYVLVDDIVSGLILASEKGRSGEKYILGGECISLRGFFKTMKKVSGKRAMPVYVPKPIAIVIGSISQLFAKLFHIYPFITTPWVKHFCADWIYVSNKAKEELGYNPTPLPEGLRITVNWLNEKKR